jgi:hypothetical protein
MRVPAPAVGRVLEALGKCDLQRKGKAWPSTVCLIMPNALEPPPELAPRFAPAVLHRSHKQGRQPGAESPGA